MNTLGRRIAIAREKSGLNQSELARKLDVTPQAVQKWETDHAKPRDKAVDLLVKVLGVSKQWLLLGDTDTPSLAHIEHFPIIAWETADDLPDDQYVIVPRVDVSFSAGNGLVNYASTPKSQGIAFMWGWIRQKGLNPKKLISVRVVGSSMFPTIPDGSIVTIDTSKTELESTRKVWAIRYGDELRIKRISKRFDGAWILESDNPEYEKEIISGEDLNHIAIIGRYVAHSFDGDI